MSNNEITEEVKEAVNEEESQQPVDPAEQFDVTRKARQVALNSVQEVLNRAVQGQKIDQRRLIKSLHALHDFSKLTDMLLIAVLGDMVKIIRAVASSEANIFAGTSKLKAMVDVLQSKEIMTEEELIEMHDTKTLPEILERMQGTPQEEPEGEPTLVEESTEVA